MTIELANRLVEFRKKFGYSQEELGNQLNVSRQSISNWESGEVTPAIDYLKELAKLYGTTLDDLLNCDKPVDEVLGKKSNEFKTENNKGDDGSFIVDDGKSFVHVSKDGLHVIDEDGSRVDIDKNGININDIKSSSKNDYKHYDDYNIKIDNDLKAKAVFVSKNKRRQRLASKVESIITGIFTLLILATYLVLGFLVKDGWLVYWTLFILIPIPGEIVSAIIKRKFCQFPIVMIVVFAYLFMGMKFSMWHPWWLLFIIIPIYYSVFGPLDKVIFEHNLNKEKEDNVITINGSDIKVKNNIEDKLNNLEDLIVKINIEINTILKTIEKCKESNDKVLVEELKADFNDVIDKLEDKIKKASDLLDDICDISDLPLDIRFKYKAEIRNARNKINDLKEKINSL